MVKDILMIPKGNMNKEETLEHWNCWNMYLYGKTKRKKEKHHMDDEHMEVIGKALHPIERTNSL